MSRNLTTWLAGLQKGDRRILAQTLSLSESKREEDRKFVLAVLEKISVKHVPTLRIGITGAPGAGKSSLIGALGLRMLKKKRDKIAVLAIDPSSPRSGGSILGDKLRMSDFAAQPQVFVRPLAGRDALAGVHLRTAEMLKICETAGYHTTIVETMGAGQTDYEIKKIVDVVITLVLPGAGDIIQGLKKGLNEMSDVFAVSKCDGEQQHSADLSRNALVQALHLSAQNTPVILTSAHAGTGIDELLATLHNFISARKDTGAFQAQREEQACALFRSELTRMLGTYLFAENKKLVQDMEKKIKKENILPSVAAQTLAEAVLYTHRRGTK